MKSSNKKILASLALVILSTFFLAVPQTQAALSNWTGIQFPPCFEPGTPRPCELTDVIQFAMGVTQVILGLAASLALVFVIYGGTVWLVSAGNAEMITKGKKVLVGSFMGLLIIVSSWVLINTLIIALTGQELSSIGQIFGQPWYQVEKGRGPCLPDPAYTPLEADLKGCCVIVRQQGDEKDYTKWGYYDSCYSQDCIYFGKQMKPIPFFHILEQDKTCQEVQKRESGS